MLSAAQVVKARKALEKGYIGKCNITEKREKKKKNGSTGFEDVVILEKQPCKLSFSSTPAVSSSGHTGNVVQTIKLFLAPEVEIKPGSKITVTQNGITEIYEKSGKPDIFPTHQEVVLELYKGKA